MATTKIKFLVVVEDEALPEHQQTKDASILSIFVRDNVWFVAFTRGESDNFNNISPLIAFLLNFRTQVKLHGLYVNYLLNPFNKLDGMIESARFEEGVRELVAAFNQTTQRYSF